MDRRTTVRDFSVPMAFWFAMFTWYGAAIHAVSIVLYLTLKFAFKVRKAAMIAMITWAVLQVCWISLLWFFLLPGFRVG